MSDTLNAIENKTSAANAELPRHVPIAEGLGGTNSTVIISVEAPPQKRELTVVDGIPWIIAGLSIAASLIWNYFNYTRTTGLQSSIRRDQVRLEEFRRLRDRVDETLKTLLTARNELLAKGRSANRIAGVRRDTLNAEREVTAAYLEFQDAVSSVDESAYAEGTNWLEAVECHWEAYADRVHSFRERPALPAALLELEAAGGELGQIGRSINRRLDAEVERYSKFGVASLTPKKRWFRPGKIDAKAKAGTPHN